MTPPSSQHGRRPYLLAAPAVALLLLFFLAPMLQLVRVSLYEGGGRSGFGIGGGFYKSGTWTLQAYRNLLEETYFRDVWTFTVLLGVGVACITLAIAYPLSLFIYRLPPRAKALALSAVVLPKLANVLVLIYGLELLLGNSGPVNGFLVGLGAASEPVTLYHNLAGVLIGETYLILPYAVLVLVAALDRIDPTLLPAARGLGAGPLRAFWRLHCHCRPRESPWRRCSA